MCCVCRRLCNTEKIVASSPTLSAYPSLPTLSAILLNRHVNNKRTTNKPIPHDIVFGFGRDRPASKKESTRNLPNGLHEKHETSLTGCTKKRKNNHKQGSWRQLVDPNQVCHILIYTSHSGTAYMYIFLDFFKVWLVGGWGVSSVRCCRRKGSRPSTARRIHRWRGDSAVVMH